EDREVLESLRGVEAGPAFTLPRVVVRAAVAVPGPRCRPWSAPRHARRPHAGNDGALPDGRRGTWCEPAPDRPPGLSPSLRPPHRAGPGVGLDQAWETDLQSRCHLRHARSYLPRRPLC